MINILDRAERVIAQFHAENPDIEQQLQQARREGWEQAKAEAVAKADELFKYEDGYYHYKEDVTDAIASMEYKHGN